MVKEINNSISSNDEYEIFEVNRLNFSSLLEIFIRRKKIFAILLLTFFSFSFSNLAYKKITRPIYRGSFTLMISDPFIGERKSSGGGFTLENIALNQNNADLATLVTYLKSQKLLKSIAKENDLSPSSLIGRVNISLPRANTFGNTSKTLIVLVEGEDTKELKIVLNKLSNAYVLSAYNARKNQISEGIKFLNQQQPMLLKRVTDAQNKLEILRLENKTMNPIVEAGNLKESIDELENKIIGLNAENIRLDSIKDNLEKGILMTQGIENGASNYLSLISGDEALLNKIIDVKAELAKSQTIYKDSSIIVQNLKSTLKALEPLLIEDQKSAVKAAIAINKGIIESSKNKLIELNTLFLPYPQLITEYSEIVNLLKNLEENLLNLLQTKEKLQLELSQELLPWKIIQDPSVGGTPIKPDVKRSSVYIIFFGLLISSLIVYLIDRLDNVFHNPKEVEKFLNNPILGVVPFFNFEPKDVIEFEENEANNSIKNLNKDQNYFIFQETFRNIFTSIKFSNIDKEIKTVSLTSAVPGEGKSIIAVFLALNISEISKKILIIDTDLRRPSLHDKLNVDNVTGLSNCLINSKSSWKDVVIKHDKYKNFSFITAGKIPPNPVRLLESKKMKDLVEDIKNSNEFDLIIFDCPPVLGLSDSIIVSNIVDGIILNVSLNKVNKTLSFETLKKLALLKTPILGLIVNSVSKSKKEDTTRNKYYTNYMPLETSQRYGMNNSDNKELEEEKIKTKIIKKIRHLFLKLKEWVYD